MGVLGWGIYIGSRRELIWTLQHRAERAEAEQELRVAQARGNERARIAREMHDVLAHRISQISHARGRPGLPRGSRRRRDAGQRGGDPGDRRTRRSPTCAACSGCCATPGPASCSAPRSRRTPTWRELVDEARDAGLNVDFHDQLDPASPMPEVVGRTVYRIVQEGITNARKHAPGATLPSG